MGAEFLTIFWRDMVKFWRLKAMLFASLIQPILWLALFGPAMGSFFENNMMTMPSVTGVVSVNYLTFMSSGIIAMTILFTCLYSGIFLQLDKQTGLLKQMMASPMEREHIFFGLSLSGTTKSLIQVIIIIVFGLILGVRFFEGFAPINIIISILGILLFVVLFAMGLMFLSLAIAMKIQSHEGVQAVITLLTLPLFFASNALYPLESMPIAIRAISSINPLTYFINGIRYFSIGSSFNSFGTQYTYTNADILISFAFLFGFMMIMYFAATRIFRKAKVV